METYNEMYGSAKFCLMCNRFNIHETPSTRRSWAIWVMCMVGLSRILHPDFYMELKVGWYIIGKPLMSRVQNSCGTFNISIVWCLWPILGVKSMPAGTILPRLGIILRATLTNLLTNFFKKLTGSQVDSNSARRELSIKPIYAIRYPSGYQDATKVSFWGSVTVHITKIMLELPSL